MCLTTRPQALAGQTRRNRNFAPDAAGSFLPAIYHTGNGPDSYCKECRKDVNRLNRKLRAYRPEAEETPPRYPVITDIREREVRMQLILNALYTVREA